MVHLWYGYGALMVRSPGCNLGNPLLLVNRPKKVIPLCKGVIYGTPMAHLWYTYGTLKPGLADHSTHTKISVTHEKKRMQFARNVVMCGLPPHLPIRRRVYAIRDKQIDQKLCFCRHIN